MSPHFHKQCCNISFNHKLQPVIGCLENMQLYTLATKFLRVSNASIIPAAESGFFFNYPSNIFYLYIYTFIGLWGIFFVSYFRVFSDLKML